MQIVKVNSLNGINSVLKQLQQSQADLDSAIQFFSDLKVEFDIPGIIEDELDVCFENGVIKISQKNKFQIQNKIYQSNHIVALNEKTRMALAVAEQMTLCDSPVILYGPIGVGKHLFARRIHQQSRHYQNPFTWLSCDAGLSDKELLEAVEKTQPGTLYLDGLDELSEGCFASVQRLFEASPGEHDCRIIAATSCNPEALCERPQPLKTLLENLTICYIELAPLAQRPEDIDPLVLYHLERLCSEKRIPLKQPSPEFLQTLNIYSWPGNVRELVNTLDQVLITAQGKKTLFARDLPNHIRIQTLKSAASRKMGL